MYNPYNEDEKCYVSSREWYEDNSSAEREKDRHTQTVASVASLAALFAGCLAALL
ncbi:MAG: hypothetical protein VZT48_08825 [Bulleidia sp.]|nr:hypothetical protein [Bulleidia sp.]